MAEATMKARVFTETTPAGLAWTYEIADPAKPEGNRLVVSGMRPTWASAMDAACGWLSRYSETKRLCLNLLKDSRTSV